MPNEYVNKVEFGNETVMDITDTTAETGDVLEGEVFYTKSGARSVGTLGDATQSAHGLMSAEDKTKLDSLSSYSVMTGATSSTAGASGLVPAPTTSDVDKFLAGDGTYKDGGRPMVILSYGNSTWNDFINAYNNNVIVYCRASSGSNPASGSQTRMAFMAYVNNATTPTEVEFQYYRSVSSHTDSQQGDQVFVYKLTSSGTWTVTTREAMARIVAGTNMSSTYSNNVLTINGNYSAMTGASSSTAGITGLVPAPSIGDNSKFLKGDGTWDNVPNPQVMTGASSSAAGVTGLVPAPSAGDESKYLRGDGTWAEGSATVYGNTIDMTSTDSTKIATAIGNKLNANQGSANEGKYMRVGATGAVSYEYPIERYSSISNFPATGDLAKVYIAVNTGKTYIWDATDGYVIIGEPHIYYGTSSSGSSDAEKAVTVSESFYAVSDIPAGTVLYVKFTNQNTRLYSLKLNVNSGGGVYVHTMDGSSDDNAFKWDAGEWVQFVFVDSRWKTIRNGVMFGATYVRVGKKGLVPAPSYGDEGKFLRGDATWANPATMTGATASAAGAAGLVPTPAAGDQNKVLTGAGTWWTAGAPLLTPSAAFSIPSVGTPAVYDMPGLTANHELIQWNFSASAENNPPASLSWETYDGYFMITNNAGTTSETIKPVFAQTVSVAITQHVEAGE